MKTTKFTSRMFQLLVCLLILDFSLTDGEAFVHASGIQQPDTSRQVVILLNSTSDSDDINNIIRTYCPGASVIEQYEDYVLIQLDSSCSPKKTAEKITKSPLVKIAEPNYTFRPMNLSKDTYASSQWALENTGQYRSYLKSSSTKASSKKGIDLNIKPAWDVYNRKSGGKHEVIVAILDTGVDVKHEDLKKNIWVNPGEIPGDGIDNDGNGYIDDINGWDFYNNDNSLCSYQHDRSTNTYEADPNDNDDHGTHVAGIIGATANNKLGIAGVASNIDVKIMPLKIEGGMQGNGTISSAVKAIKYAELMGAKVCNISWGSSLNSAALAQAIKESSMLFVAAAGNTGANTDKNPMYPANYNLDNIISVTFIDAQGQLYSLSNYGKHSVDLAAPGFDILSTTVGSTYSSMSGSSMAVPHISGLAAMVYASQSHLYASQVKQLILSSIRPLPSLKGKVIHAGIPDAEKLVYAIHQLVPDTSAPSISCSTSYTKSSIKVKIGSSDKGGSGIRVIKYLYGRQSLSDFEGGTVGTTVTSTTVNIPKTGFYTFYISDYAGNEQRKICEIREDKLAPVITADWKQLSKDHMFLVTGSVTDRQSGVKEVRYLKGRKNSKDFSSNKGTLLKLDDSSYQFKAEGGKTYTIYAVDRRGNKTTHVIQMR